MMDNTYLTPQQIVEELDKYIIGQYDAKRNVAIALRNRWRRMSVETDMQREIVPNNILMIGATGVGKTEIARRLARIADAPFVKVEASKFTEVGYVGRDGESRERDVVDRAVNLVTGAKKDQRSGKGAVAVEELVLHLWTPPLGPQPAPKPPGFSPTRGVTPPEPDPELTEPTGTLFGEKTPN